MRNFLPKQIVFPLCNVDFWCNRCDEESVFGILSLFIAAIINTNLNCFLSGFGITQEKLIWLYRTKVKFFVNLRGKSLENTMSSGCSRENAFEMHQQLPCSGNPFRESTSNLSWGNGISTLLWVQSLRIQICF